MLRVVPILTIHSHSMPVAANQTDNFPTYTITVEDVSTVPHSNSHRLELTDMS